MIPDPRTFPTRQILQQFAGQMPELDASAALALVHFARTAMDVLAAAEVHFSRWGLSQGKFGVLMALSPRLEQGLSPSELAEISGVTRGTITGLLDGLERDGLIERAGHPGDRRRTTVRLTPAGLRLLTEMLPDHFRRIAALMADVTLDERAMLIEVMDKLRTRMAELRDPHMAFTHP